MPGRRPGPGDGGGGGGGGRGGGGAAAPVAADEALLANVAREKAEDIPYRQNADFELAGSTTGLTAYTLTVADSFQQTFTAIALFSDMINGTAMGGTGDDGAGLLDLARPRGMRALARNRPIQYRDPGQIYRPAGNQPEDNFYQYALQLIPGFSMAASAKVAYNRVFQEGPLSASVQAAGGGPPVTISRRECHALSTWPLAEYMTAVLVVAASFVINPPLVTVDDIKRRIVSAIKGDLEVVQANMNLAPITDNAKITAYITDWTYVQQKRKAAMLAREPIGPFANEFVDQVAAAFGVGYLPSEIMAQVRFHMTKRANQLVAMRNVSFTGANRHDIQRASVNLTLPYVVKLTSDSATKPDIPLVLPLPVMGWAAQASNSFMYQRTQIIPDPLTGVPIADATATLPWVDPFARGFDLATAFDSLTWNDFEWPRVLEGWVDRLYGQWMNHMASVPSQAGNANPGVASPVDGLGARANPAYERIPRLVDANKSNYEDLERASSFELHIASGSLCWDGVENATIVAIPTFLFGRDEAVATHLLEPILDRYLNAYTRTYTALPWANPKYAAVLEADVLRWRLQDANILQTMTNPVIKAGVSRAVESIREVCRRATVCIWSLIENGGLMQHLVNFVALWINYTNCTTRGRMFNDGDTADRCSTDIMRYRLFFGNLRVDEKVVAGVTVAELSDESIPGTMASRPLRRRRTFI